jgi:superoxide dismutase, Fe-Mn family
MYTLPELPYAYNALEPHIDEMTMKIHHTKHHQAYIDNVNAVLEGEEKLAAMPIEELVKNLSRVPESIRTKVRNNAGGHANHIMFWQSMGPVETHAEPSGELAVSINKTFGSLASFQETFGKVGLARFGSGWVWLTMEGSSLAIIDTPNQDSPLMEHKIPILGLDVWEHAYYLKYQNKRVDYIKSWWNVVNWKEVEKRFARSAS